MFDVPLHRDLKKDYARYGEVRDGHEMVAFAFGNKIAKTKPLR